MNASVPLSIIIPVLNESAGIRSTLEQLAPLRSRGAEVVLVDGGSDDDTVMRATSHVDLVIYSQRGRARQMNAGALASRGDVLLFLHADTSLPDNADQLILNGLRETGKTWGRFDVRITSTSRILSIVALLMNLRSRLTGIATGDQAIFIQRDVFSTVDGFPQQDLMEDIEISRRLKRRSLPLYLHERVTTSGRRWEKHGVWRTILLMWRLRFQYWLGTPASKLSEKYR